MRTYPEFQHDPRPAEPLPGRPHGGAIPPVRRGDQGRQPASPVAGGVARVVPLAGSGLGGCFAVLGSLDFRRAILSAVSSILLR